MEASPDQPNSLYSTAHARQLDQSDPLAHYRDALYIDDPNVLYMDGNSLGRLPLASRERLGAVIQNDWGSHLIRSWGEGWLEAPQRIGDKIGRLVGAAAGQVLVSDATSVNLFKLVMAAPQLNAGRRKLISDVFNFPSDLYVMQSCLQLAGPDYCLELIPSRDGITIDPGDVANALDKQSAVLVLSQAAFKSGFLYDLASITEMAHRRGLLVIWDLSHSVGVVPIDLDGCDVDFAVGCTYKYLNGGPGAPAFLYVNQRLQDQARSPIWGWFGQAQPFAFDLDYRPAGGARQFQTGTPPMLSLLGVEPGVDLVLQSGLPAIREKSLLLTSYLIDLFDHYLAPLGFSLGTPRQSGLRGSHVSIRHPLGYQINRALIEEMQVIPDFREPDNIRHGLAPLYTSFNEVFETVQRLRLVIEQGRHTAYPPTRQAVT